MSHLRPALDVHSSRNSEWDFDKIFKFVVVRSFTADSNLLQPTGWCEQNTLTRHIVGSPTAERTLEEGCFVRREKPSTPHVVLWRMEGLALQARVVYAS